METVSPITVSLTPDIEQAVIQRARQRGLTPEAVVLDVLREKLSQPSPESASPGSARDEWEARVRSLATHCGVSLSDEAVSREGLYD